MATVDVKPELLQWALDRAGLTTADVRKKFTKVDEWLIGDRSPTFKQLEQFAKKTMVPFGYLFLKEPPVEKLPIPDYRTVGDSPIDRPSPNLIDTLHTMQRRQSWMRERLVEQGHAKLELVGSGRKAKNAVSLAQVIRKELGLPADWAEPLATWQDALRVLRRAIEQVGILVFSNSVVGMNNNRKLDPEEFRGFVLSDDYAPLIFVNSADSKSAQMFTLAHELAHIWLDQGGIFNLIKMMPHSDETERFCNQVAAEFLVPSYKLKENWKAAKTKSNPFKQLAGQFKVSPLVIARKALDSKLINQAQFFKYYRKMQDEWNRLNAEKKKRKKSGGPSPYVVADSRLSKRFTSAVVTSTKEGKTLYQDAYGLIGMQGATYQTYAQQVIKRMKNERQ